MPDVVAAAPSESEIELAAASEVAPADEAVVALAQEMPHKEVLDKEMPDKMPSPPDLMQDRYSLLRNLTQ